MSSFCWDHIVFSSAGRLNDEGADTFPQCLGKVQKNVGTPSNEERHVVLGLEASGSEGRGVDNIN